MTKRGILLLDTAVVACGATLYALWNKLAVYLPECPIKEYLGIYCAGCGGTRFVYHLMHFNFVTAFRNNLYLFLFTAYLIVSLILFNLSYFSGKKIYTVLVNEKWLWFWAVSGVLFFILRNIPAFPFMYLAPL